MGSKIKNIFVEGAIPPEKISKSIAAHQHKTGIGGHCIFLGQVRADVVANKTVKAIEYTTQNIMANQLCHEIKEKAFAKYPIHCMHIYHSLGAVATGDLCFFVFVSSAHRTNLYNALEEIVQEIKDTLPIFGKEIFEDDSHQWKTNRK